MKKAARLIVFVSAMLPLAGVCDTAAERERRTDEIAAWLQDEPRADGARWSDRAAWRRLAAMPEAAVAFKFMSHMNQVGQTGSTPRHAKGLSTCCHGEEPHVVGWRFVNERRAVNLDANCGWAQGKADVVYVADAFAVMKKVNELLG
jgi:hypothetical protein